MKFKIVTSYTFKREIMKTNRSMHVEQAILNAIKHLQRNDYAASMAQVSCGETGRLYAIILRNIVGRIRIKYEKLPATVPPIFVEDPYGRV